MNNSYTIKDLIALLLSKIVFLVVCTFVVGIAAFLTSSFIMPPKYESYVSMYVKNGNFNKEEQNDVDLNDLNASKSLVSTYIAVLKSNTLMSEIGDKLVETYDQGKLSAAFSLKDGKISPDAILSCFTMSAVEETEVMKITANTEDPELSAALCEIMGELAPDFLVRVVGAGSVEIVDTPFPNDKPVSPNIPLITLFGAIIGLGASIFVVLLIDFFDNTIKEASTLEQKYNKAIIGQVQMLVTDKKTKEKKKKKKKNADTVPELETDQHFKLTDEDVPFYIVESFKSIRTNVSFALATSDKKIFAVSSANAGEGKSTTSSNIAIAFAQSGKNVLLIDADMRKNVQNTIFGLDNTSGLSTAIVGEKNVSEYIQTFSFIQKDKKGNEKTFTLDILPSGPVPPNPSELLGSTRFSDMLGQLNYDIVIIDTPPVNVVTDSMELAKVISGMLLVVKQNYTTEEDVEMAMKKIEFSKIHMLGFVMNGTVSGHHGAYNYKYKRGGDYKKYTNYDEK